MTVGNVGIVGRFDSPQRLQHAVEELRRLGYRRLDAYTPYPVEGVQSALGQGRSPAAMMIFPVAVLGAAFGFGIQAWLNGYLFPLNVGGRPPISVFPFFVITFETMVLFCAVGSVVLLFWLCRLPRLHHPLFAVEGFTSATLDAFWVGINAADAHFDEDATKADLHALGAAQVQLVGDAQ